MIRNEKDKTTFGIIDAQSVQNADTAEEKGNTANITDRQGALEMITENRDTLSKGEKYLVDGGYSVDKFAEAVNLESEDFHEYATAAKVPVMLFSRGKPA